MELIQKEFEKLKLKKKQKQFHSLKWGNSILAVYSGKEPQKKYIDLQFHSMLFSVFTNHFENLKLQTIDNLFKNMYKNRQRAADIRLRLSDNNICLDKFFTYCFFKFQEYNPTFYNAITFFYNILMREFDYWITESSLVINSIRQLVMKNPRGVKFLEDLERLKTI